MKRKQLVSDAIRETNADGQSARARRAVTRFRAMMPTLTSYARVVSNNPKVRIQITANNGASTKDRILIRPPIALGDYVPHDETRCDERDLDGVQACDACRIHEHLMAVIYHEIGHIALGTHGKPTTAAYSYALKEILNLKHPEDIRDSDAQLQLRSRYQEVPDPTYMVLANALHPYLGILYNATEDARVNEGIFRMRRGIRAMYNSLMHEIIRDGVPNPNDPTEYMYWRDMSLEFQMVLAVTNYLQRLPDPNRDLFIEQIYNDLADAELIAHLESWSPEPGNFANFKYTVDLLKILNRLGYLKPEGQPESESDTEGGDTSGAGSGDSAGQDSSGGGGAPSEGEQSDTDPKDESDDESSDQDESDGDSKSGSNGSDESGADEQPQERPGTPSDRARPGGDLSKIKVCLGEQLEPGVHGEDPAKTEKKTEAATKKAEKALQEAIRRALEKAIEQAQWFEMPSKEIEGIRFIEFGSPEWGSRRYRDDEQVLHVAKPALNSAVLKGRVTFDANRRKRKQHNLKRGRVSPNVLGKRAALGDERLFHKEVIPGKRDYFVQIGMDLSGSTQGRNITLEKDAIFAQGELLSRLGIPFEIVGPTPGTWTATHSNTCARSARCRLRQRRSSCTTRTARCQWRTTRKSWRFSSARSATVDDGELF